MVASLSCAELGTAQPQLAVLVVVVNFVDIVVVIVVVVLALLVFTGHLIFSCGQ